MLLWFVGASIVVVWSVFRSPALDYRLVALDGGNKRALVTGGRLFQESTEVRVEGSTSGGTAIKPGFIGIGLRLEMSNGSNRITTSVVQSMSLDPPPASRVC